MRTKNGIPMDIGQRFKESKKNIVKARNIIAKNGYNSYVELEKEQGVTCMVPLESSFYFKAIKEGYTKELERWSV